MRGIRFDIELIGGATFNAGAKHDTHYIYDDFGNLTFVFSPEASDKIMVLNNQTWELVPNPDRTAILDDLSYQYRYDYRSRLTEKKIPGKDWEYILYDNLDRPVLTQDAYLRADNNKWLFTKYDALGRVVYTGIVTNPPARTVIEQNLRIPTAVSEERVPVGVVIGDVTLYYTNWAFPTQDIEVLTVNYYNNYIDYSGVTKPQVVLGVNTTEHPAVPTTTKGLPTVSKVRVLGTTDWITTLTGYDEKGRVLYVDSRNVYLDTRDIIKNKLDFTGKVLESETLHLKTGHATIITKDFFTYDHIGRLKTHLQEIDDEPLQLIVDNTYDELGQLKQKKVGGELWKTGYTDIVNVSVSTEGVITKDAGNDYYDAGLATVGLLKGDGGLSFTNVAGSKKHLVGFNNDNGNENQFEIDYRFSFPWENMNFRVQAKEGPNTLNLTDNLPYQVGDTFAIERQGNELYFIHNGTTIANYTMTQDYPALVGDISFKTMGASIKDLNFYATDLTKHLQDVDYDYNIRGWLTKINTPGTIDPSDLDLFHYRINYNNDILGTVGDQGKATPLYNGNISQTVWRTKNMDKEKRSYGYKYDHLNRLVAAYSTKGAALITSDKFEVPLISYDLNGNILSLDRNGYLEGNTDEAGVKWDDLSYEYNGNQLSYVEDVTTTNAKDEGFKNGHIGNANTPDYDYDDNGNMTFDLNKGISLITYNYLNLPEIVTIDNGTQAGTITYVYDATGVKQKKTLQQPSTPDVHTEYAGNYVYSDMLSVGSMELQFFNHPEGYIEPTPVGGSKSVGGFDTGTGEVTYSAYHYVFQFKDHLGNVRLSYADSDLNGAITAGEIIEESNYYPFGLKQKGYNYNVTGNGNSLAQQWKFGGKEYNEELGLNWYDVTARNYDPAIGRWMNIDPLADQMRRHSPYNYAFDNPIYYMDYDGMAPSGPWPPIKWAVALKMAWDNSKVKRDLKNIGDDLDNGWRAESNSKDNGGKGAFTNWGDNNSDGLGGAKDKLGKGVISTDTDDIPTLPGGKRIKNAGANGNKSISKNIKKGKTEAKEGKKIVDGISGVSKNLPEKKSDTTMTISTMEVSEVGKNDNGKTYVVQTPNVRDTTVTQGQESNVRNFENQENLKSDTEVGNILKGN